MYEAVRDLLPDLDPVFADPYSAALRAEVTAVCNTLGLSIKGIFMELENLIAVILLELQPKVEAYIPSLGMSELSPCCLWVATDIGRGDGR